MNRRLISFLLVFALIVLGTVLAVLVAKGYRFDNQTHTIQGTGIIAVSSIPTGASIYLDGEFVSASNNSLPNLPPKTYQLKIAKDGFSTWQKPVIVQAEKVTLVSVTLFPSTPDLRPLTFSGVKSPQLSPDGGHLLYAVTESSKAGLWVLDLTSRFLAFSRDPKQIAKDSTRFSYTEASFSWAPDSKTVLVTGKNSSGRAVSYLLDAESSNDTPVDVSATIGQTMSGWESDQDLKNQDLLNRLPDSVKTQVSSATKALWSPDELKVAFTADGKLRIYDLKLDRLSAATATEFSWYPDSDHLILVEDGHISIIEADGQNKTPIYGGSFVKSAVFPWPDGTKLIILTSFNEAAGQNLYNISLR